MYLSASDQEIELNLRQTDRNAQHIFGFRTGQPLRDQCVPSSLHNYENLICSPDGHTVSQEGQHLGLYVPIRGLYLPVISYGLSAFSNKAEMPFSKR